MINRVVLVGRLTKDPELRYTPSGVAVARFTLAVNRTYTNNQGEKEADFINITVWRKPAENAANYLKKGNMAGVEGRITTSNFEGTDGKRVYVTDVTADSVQFLEPKSKNSGGDNNYSSYQNQRSENNSGGGNQQSSGNNGGNNQQNNYQQQPNNDNRNNPGYSIDDDPFTNSGPIEISDDDLPF